VVCRKIFKKAISVPCAEKDWVTLSYSPYLPTLKLLSYPPMHKLSPHKIKLHFQSNLKAKTPLHPLLINISTNSNKFQSVKHMTSTKLNIMKMLNEKQSSNIEAHGNCNFIYLLELTLWASVFCLFTFAIFIGFLSLSQSTIYSSSSFSLVSFRWLWWIFFSKPQSSTWFVWEWTVKSWLKIKFFSLYLRGNSIMEEMKNLFIYFPFFQQMSINFLSSSVLLEKLLKKIA